VEFPLHIWTEENDQLHTSAAILIMCWITGWTVTHTIIIIIKDMSTSKFNTKESSVYGSRVGSISEITTAIVGILDCLPLFLLAWCDYN
jgi:hypothetical protein